MGSVTCCPYAKIGVDRTVQNSHVTVFCSVPLVFLKSGVLQTVNGATCSKKCLWWLKARSNLNLRAQQQSKFKVHSFYYNIIYSSKTKTWCYFAVVFVCTVQCFTKIFFFDLTTLSDIKMAFCGCNFSSNLVLKYVK
jgi:hypothetical protein